jgi:hypothetical protein
MASKRLAARQQFIAEVDAATVLVLQSARFPVASAVVKRNPKMFKELVEGFIATPARRGRDDRRGGGRGVSFSSLPRPLANRYRTTFDR